MAQFTTPSILSENNDTDRATTSSGLPASSPYLLPIPTYLAANPSVTNLMGSAAVFFTASPLPSPASTVRTDTNLLHPTHAQYHHPHHHRHQSPPSSETKLLLVQRAPTDFLPLKWELPGGSVEPETDSSVVAGAIRELEEETGLRASKVVRSIGTREFGETVPSPLGSDRNCLWRMCIFEVEVEVEGDGDGDGEEENNIPVAAPAGLVPVEEHVKFRSAAEILEGQTALTVRLDPAEHVAYLWVSEDEVREGWCGDVELDFTDPEGKGILLRAFELHRTGVDSSAALET